MKNLHIKLLCGILILGSSIGLTFLCAYLNQFCDEHAWYGPVGSLWCFMVGFCAVIGGPLGIAAIWMNL